MADPAPSGNPTNFASLMSSLTSRDKEAPGPWDVSALADDVATISYEQALRTHRRVRADRSGPESITSNSNAPAASTETTKARKTVSVTIRVTADEGRQLQARATEAGLSASAYLRSCIFEAESLRAQVKEALAQMRASASADKVPLAIDKPSSSPIGLWAKWRSIRHRS